MNDAPPLQRLSATSDYLTIEWANGEVAEFASIWLRDNRRADRDPHSGQRLTDIADLPECPRIRSAESAAGIVRIVWEDDPAIAEFEPGWLWEHVADRCAQRPENVVRRWPERAPPVAHDFAWNTLERWRNDAAGRLDWLTSLLQTGVAFLSGVPSTNEAILEAMTLAGRVCDTNYGLVFDVRAVPQPENLAYSDLGLGLHTDNPYREPVPGFQALHVLLASPAGGDNVFADGFALAEHLRTHDRQAFERLTQTPVPFRYRSKNAALVAERPLIELSCRGEIIAVHYNSRSIAPLRLPARDTAPFYAAYRRFAKLLREPSFQLTIRLRDGDLVLFDNQRILHGRTAFLSATYGRHLRGCYLTRDSVYSETALLRHALAGESA